jgi:hypothetical protein
MLKIKMFGVLWHRPVILALRRLKQEITSLRPNVPKLASNLTVLLPQSSEWLGLWIHTISPG